MSARSLQRKLQDSGSTFQRLLEDARHEMARYYLSNSVLELTEAAYLLGYEDANSFARAFRATRGRSAQRLAKRIGAPLCTEEQSPTRARRKTVIVKFSFE